MSNQPRRAHSAPNSAIDTSTAQGRHLRIAHASIVESRSPAQIEKDSHRATLAGTSNGPLPTDIARGK